MRGHRNLYLESSVKHAMEVHKRTIDMILCQQYQRRPVTFIEPLKSSMITRKPYYFGNE
jgi:hypothetical protein